MADEHNKWLDRDAAERLLRGEPLEAVDAVTRARAARLAETLDALAVTRVDGGELPGEAAALAAFRKVRESGAQEPGAVPLKARHARPRGALAPVSPLHVPVGRENEANTNNANANAGTGGPAGPDVGSVRLARPDARPVRWGRPVRFGMAAALAGCMIGGVAVAAGTGVIPSPFGGGEPGPAASVSAAASPEQPLASPSPDISDTDGGRSGGAVPDGSSPGPGSDAPSQDDTADRHGPTTTRPGTGLRESDAADQEAGRQRLVDTCRKYRDGGLSDSQTERLKDAAKRIATNRRDRDPDRFCARVLGEADDTLSGDDGNGTKGDDKNSGKDGDEDSQNGEDPGVSGAVPTASWVPSEPGGDASDNAPTTPSTTASASASYSAAPAQP
ncbi:hypothetical protein ABZS88_22120 [Streptomyces sp. NPDC005480]|uniref:hypothetical protein n=1 Tax=Streptomyces sp. NPDC005480 TaxID=3154880 RepID=UPI0033A47358